MRKIALLSALLYISVCAMAQEDTTDNQNLDEMVVFSNKFAEKKKNLAQKIDVINARACLLYTSRCV